MSKCIFSRCLQFKQFSEWYRKAFRSWGFHKIKWQGESLIETLHRIRSKSKKSVYLRFEIISFASRVSALRLRQFSMRHVRNGFQVNIVSAGKQLLSERSRSRRFNRKYERSTKSLQTLWISMILRFFWRMNALTWEMTIHWRQTGFCWCQKLYSLPKESSLVESFRFDIQIVTTLIHVCNSSCDNQQSGCFWKVSNFWHKLLSISKSVVSKNFARLINLFRSTCFHCIKLVNIFNNFAVVSPDHPRQRKTTFVSNVFHRL